MGQFRHPLQVALKRQQEFNDVKADAPNAPIAQMFQSGLIGAASLSRNVRWTRDMKRDLTLIRHLLVYVEEQPAGTITRQVTVLEDTDGPTVGEHIALLVERGLLDGTVLDVNAPAFAITGLTWEGHDFLHAVRNETVWRRVLAKSKELGGGLTLEIAKELGKKYLRELAGL